MTDLDRYCVNYSNSISYAVLCARRLRIDKYRCQVCSGSDNLIVHRRTKECIGKENAKKDLITLCEACHHAVSKSKKDREKLMRRLGIASFKKPKKKKKRRSE